MMFSPIPDKLSVMTYVFQIKTYFSRPPALPPSPLSIKTPAPRSRPAPPPPQAAMTSKEEPIDLADVSLACNSSVIDDSGKGKEKSLEGYNPFLDNDEGMEVDSTPEMSTDTSATNLSHADENSVIEKETVLDSSNSVISENKNSLQEGTSKESDVPVKNVIKPPPKPPRLFQTTSTPSVESKAEATGLVDKKDKSDSNGYNPFDEDEPDEIVSKKKVASPSKSRKPPEGYNPFDEDEGSVDSREQIVNDKETKHGYNPFDDDGDSGDVTQNGKVVDEIAVKKEKRKKKVSYPHSFNPFEEDDNLKSSETGESSQSTQSKDSKSDKDSSSKSYNPFDEDDDEGVGNDASQVESSTRKSSWENKGRASPVAQSGRDSPSGMRKQLVSWVLHGNYFLIVGGYLVACHGMEACLIERKMDPIDLSRLCSKKYHREPKGSQP